MKFFHLGDLHFGKQLHNVQLVERDQPDWVEQFLGAVDRCHPDAVVIAGDVYDRKIPSPEAMKLFDRLLTELVRRDRYVLIVPGNHDSAARLSHVKELLRTHKVFIAGELEKQLMKIPVSDGTQTVNFWLMPYVFPKLVSDRRVLDADELSTYDEAVRALLVEQRIDSRECNVLVAHQNVLANGTAPIHSGSETIVGGLGEIEVSAFDAFDYVALGHIHNAQRVGRDTVRYSGCPLYYDFSEINRRKELTLITIEKKGAVSVEFVDIPILHRMKQVSGTLEELIAQGQSLTDREQFYIQAVLRDKRIPPHAMEQLRAVFGENLLNVKREIPEEYRAAAVGSAAGIGRSLSLEDQFSAFYQEQAGELLDGTQEELIHLILEQQSRSDGDYVAKIESIPGGDTVELIDHLLKNAEEDAE